MGPSGVATVVVKRRGVVRERGIGILGGLRGEQEIEEEA